MGALPVVSSPNRIIMKSNMGRFRGARAPRARKEAKTVLKLLGPCICKQTREVCSLGPGPRAT